MPLGFRSRHSPIPPSVFDPLPGIDSNKRYDVYCNRRDEIIVYRSVLFKGMKSILPGARPDIGNSFLELEQANGETIFIARMHINTFCEHGTNVSFETL